MKVVPSERKLRAGFHSSLLCIHVCGGQQIQLKAGDKERGRSVEVTAVERELTDAVDGDT